MELLSCLGLTCIKSSIIMFYRRIFVTSKRSLLHIFSIFMLVIVAIWCIGFFLAWIFGCGTNVAANWGSRIDLAEYCVPRFSGGLSLAYLGSDLAIDIIILVMPLPTVRTQLLGTFPTNIHG